MKKIFLAIAVCLFMTSIMSGCKHNEREYFDAEYTALNMWLGSQRTPTETATYNFVHHNDMDYISFYVRLTGVPVDYDRTFNIEAVEGDISKVDYVTEDYVLAAGEYEATFPIYFAKPEDYNEFRDSDGYIVFKLKAGSTFEDGAESTGGIELNRLHIVLQNSVTKPWNWDEDTYPYMPLANYFGSYSNVKYEFMAGVIGLSDIRVLYGTDLSEEAENVITYLQANYLATKCRTALVEFNADPENIASGKAPLTDEYGFAVTF